MSRKGLRSIAINATYLSTAKAFTSIARALYAVLLAKWLGAELYGEFNYGLSWYVLLVPVSALGLRALIVREIGRDRMRVEQLLGQTLALRTISSLAVALFSCLLAWFVEPDPTSRLILFIFSAALLGRSLALWSTAVFIGFEASGFVLSQEALFRLLEVALGIVLLLFGFGIVELAIVHAMSWLLQGLAGLWLTRRYLLHVHLDWNRQALTSLLKRGAPFLVSSFLVGWFLQGPIVMYRHLEGFGLELGQLALALQALFIIGAVASELGGAALPVLARSVDRGDGKSDHYVDLVLRGGLLIGGVPAIAALAVGPWLIDLLFGPSYALTANLLPWTLILVAPYFWIRALSSMIVAHGRYWMVMLNNAVGAFIFTIVFPWLVSALDLSGVVIAIALGLVASLIGQLVTLRNYHSVAFMKVISRTVSTVAVALMATYLALYLNQWVALMAGLVVLIGCSFMFGVFRVGEIRIATAIARSMMSTKPGD